MNEIHFTGAPELMPELPAGDLVTVKTLTETGKEIPCTCIMPVERCATGLPGLRVEIPSPEVRQIIVELPPLYYPGGNDQVIMPRSAGKRMKNPAQSLFAPAVWTTTGWKDRSLSTDERGKLYPWEIDAPESEWSFKAALQFITYGDDKRSVYLGCCDPTFENSFVSIRCKRGEKALHLSYKKSWNCDKSGSFEFSFGVLPGDWRAAAKVYRKWFDKVETFGTDAEELDYYLEMCRYSAVTYEGFKERMAADPIYQEKLATAPNAARPELAKEFAIRDFVEHIFHMVQRNGGMNRSVSIGFSDDDKGNVKTVSSYIREELSRRFEGIKFVVYDTSDRSLAKGRKVCVSGQLNLPGF